MLSVKPFPNDPQWLQLSRKPEKPMHYFVGISIGFTAPDVEAMRAIELEWVTEPTVAEIAQDE
jgi:hypothetical protein